MRNSALGYFGDENNDWAEARAILNVH